MAKCCCDLKQIIRSTYGDFGYDAANYYCSLVVSYKSVAAVPVISDVVFVLMSPTLVASLLVPDVGSTAT
jgi:hypothetical protein